MPRSASTISTSVSRLLAAKRATFSVLRTLQAAIYKLSAGDTTLPMTITADAQAAHENVVRAMDAAGQMGFVHLSITTRQPARSGSADVQ